MKVYAVLYNGLTQAICSTRRKAEKMGRHIEELDELPEESRGMFIEIDEYELDYEVEVGKL